MMKQLLLFVCALILAGASFGQLTGTKNIPGVGGPNDYVSLAVAIADLNTWGVGPGGVTFEIAAGYTETFLNSTKGLITASGSSANPVIFRKAGTGANPVITAGVGVSTTVDGIIVIAGGDFFTFDGIDLAENATNITATTQMEWGYAMVKASSTFPVNGCQNITIQNCTITLNRENFNSVGIYAGNHTSMSLNSLNLDVLGTLGNPDLLNNCRFYSNSISNVCYGFKITGYNDINAPYNYYDHNNEIGAIGAGNAISNIGSSSNQTYGIYTNNHSNIKIAYNTVTGGGTTGNITAITPRVCTSAEIHHNTISIGNASGNSSVYGIDAYGSGTPGNIVDIHDNQIVNCFHSGTGSFTGIAGGTGQPSVMNINDNTISGNSITTGSMTLIDGGAGIVNNIFNNHLYNNSKSGAGTLSGIRSFYYGVNIHDNLIHSNNIATIGIVTSSATLYGINCGQNGQTSETIYNNLIYDLNITGTTTSTSNSVYGIYTDIPLNANRTWYGNTVRNLSISTPAGSGTIYGFRCEDSNISDIYKNQAFDLMATNAAAIIHGIYIGANGGRQINVYNNFISDLKTPAASGLNAVNGITVAGGAAVGLYYNTVYLNATSSAATFGSSGINKTGTATLADFRNNVIMNASIPGSTGGFTVSYRMTGAYNATYYSPLSNANNYYAGTPASNRLVFFDGINADQTMGAYQARVSPRDALSFSENSPLMNIATAPYDLHMNPAIATLCESGGVPVTSPAITDDFDGNLRSVTPDVGADEFAGTSTIIINPTAFIPAVVNSRQVSLPFQMNPSGNTVVIVWNTSGYFTAPSGPPPALNSPFAGGTLLSSGTVSPVVHSGLTGGITYYYKAFSYNGSAYSNGVPASAMTGVVPPTAFSAYGINNGRIDLSWTKNTLNNDVVIATNTTSTFGLPLNGTAYMAGNSIPGGGTVIYVGPLALFSHTGLTPNTKYYYKVWSADAYNWYSSTGPSTSATTLLCGPTAAFPFNESFDTYVSPAIGCGSTIDGNGDGATWATIAGGTNPAPHSSPNQLRIAASSSGNFTNDDWYFVQGLTLTAGLTYKLTFWFRPQTTNGFHSFEVKWGTSPTPGGMYSPAIFSRTAAWNPVVYEQATCYLTPASTGTYYIGWHSFADASYSSVPALYLDDINVSTNSCVAPPSVSASSITSTNAVIGWTGDATEVEIDYGTAGHAAGTGTIITATANPATLSSLLPFTTYDVYVRKVCDPIFLEYSFWTGPVSFTTAFVPASVSTSAATALTGTGATLNGSVNANGTSTRVYFEYGLSTGYGSMISATPSPVTGSAGTAVSAIVSGLVANGLDYHYRAVGFSNGVAIYGDDQIFTTTAVAPTATTTAAGDITSVGATLNGIVNPNNSSTAISFEYGIDLTYGSTVTASPSTLSGTAAGNVSASITGLVPGTVYHCRVSATNEAGTTTGNDLTFTASDAPTVTTTTFTWAPSIATLSGTVNANGYSTVVSFQYGTTTAYGSTSTVATPVTGNTPTDITSPNITGLTLNTLYHYRIVGVNSAGTFYGADMTFTTSAPPVFAVTSPTATFAATGVTMTWSSGVNPNNASTIVSFEYGTTTEYGTLGYASQSPLSLTGFKTVSMLIPTGTGLIPGTLYHFRINATNIAGTITSNDYTFTTPVLPTPTTAAATLVTSTGAKMNGTVLTNVATGTNFRYEYGLTTSYGLTNTPSPSSGSTNASFSPVGTLSGLVPNTTYHYRLYAVNAVGTVYGNDFTFTTLPVLPVVVTTAAYAVLPDGATLTGTVNPQNSSTDVIFEYGLTITYGSTATAPQSPVSGTAVTGVSVSITGLLPYTVYHYRVTGTNGTGSTSGSDMTFTTQALLPAVTTGTAMNIIGDGATLKGIVNANNSSTASIFEYGLTKDYGLVATALPSTVTGSSDTEISATISGLLSNSIYHYRVVGTNAAGTSYGADNTFHTVTYPLTGIKNIPGAGGPDDYFTIAAAIADLNSRGVGTGGVTFNVAAGYTETFLSPTAGFVTASGNAGNPVIFQKSGVGANPVVTAGIGTSTTLDGMITLAGGDYFTFDGIDLAESAGNTTATTQMEWGYGMIKASATFPANGCQNVTIKNCAITLNNANQYSTGIYSGNHVSTSLAAINLSSIGTVGAADVMNNCRFYNNTISNVCYGFKLSGYNDLSTIPATLYDQNNEIGTADGGNTISNIGSSNFITYGIYVHNQTNVQIAYNTITGGGTTSNLTGITPRTSNSAYIHHNTISLTSAPASNSSMYAIDGNAAGYGSYTVEIHDNLIQNCMQSGGGSFTAISGGNGNPAVFNIYSNTIVGNTAGSGSVTFIEAGPGNNSNVYGNTIHHNTKTGAGTMICLRNWYYNTSIHDNLVYSNNIATTGIVTSAANLYGINNGNQLQTSETIYNNTIYDLNISGTIANASNNIYGISSDIPSTASRTIYNNVVRNLAISGPNAGGTVYGIRLENGKTSDVYKNQVYDLTTNGSGGIVHGIYTGVVSRGNVYNNFVSDLKAPATVSTLAVPSAVNGITIGNGTYIGLYYNTVYLNASSSGASFGTSGIYNFGGINTVADIRNNVIMNLSTPGSTAGYTVAYRQTSAYNAANYSPASNANNFYAGIPASNKLIYSDGINTDMTIAAFKARVAPKDALSFTENAPLMNVASTPYDLHMNTTVATLCESGAVQMVSPAITDDFDGNLRSVTPDVGADEFAGITIGVINPSAFVPSTLNSQQINLPFALNPSANQVVIVWNKTGLFTIPTGNPPAVNGSFAGGTLLFNGINSPVVHSGLTGGTTYYYKAFSFDGNSYSTGVPASATTSIAPPTALAGYAMSQTRIDLSWTKNILNNDVIIATNSTSTFGQPVNGTVYPVGSSLPTGGTVIYAGPLAEFSHTGLTANTKYYYKIWSVDTYSWYSATGASTSITTMLCGPTATLPFNEGFETYTPPAVGCGTIIDANNDGITWGSATASSPAAHGGTKHLVIASGTIQNDDWYFIQGLTLTAGVTYNLSFWYRPQYTTYAETFEVKWGTSPTPAGMYPTPLFAITGIYNPITYRQASVYFTPETSGTYYIGWHSNCDAYTNNSYIDDINVTGNTCTKPLTVTATGITASTADIGWTGDATEAEIDYGQVGHVAGTGTIVSATANPTTISSLIPSTTYEVYVRKVCDPIFLEYSFWTGPITFTTSYFPPVVTTDAATLLTGTGATLNGTVNSFGVSTVVYFEYGQTEGYGLTVPASPSPVTGTAATSVSALITGLAANGTTYHFRAVGFSGGILTYGADQTFVTPQIAPTVVTALASAINPSGATLNGTVNANNSASSVTFEYGLTTDYGSMATATPSILSGGTAVSASTILTGLITGSTYHYRISATNGAGTSNGADMTFIASEAPAVITLAATYVAPATTATLAGSVNANGYSTAVSFQYGTTTAYGSTSTVAAPVTGNSATPVSVTSGTLLLNTLYHYRAVGVNSGGTSYGDDVTFTTAAAPVLAATSPAATFTNTTGVTLTWSSGVNPNNASTTVVFEYGTTTSYGATANASQSPLSGTGLKTVSAIIPGLLPATLYNFRIVATNIAGTTTSSNYTFTTPALPTPTTLAATLVTSAGAKLNGNVLTNAAVTTIFRYEYGLTTAYGSTNTPSPSQGTTNASFSPVGTVSGLVPATTYHYRLYATNSVGTVYGSDMTFTTLGIAPTVATIAAFNILPNGATLNGTINANGSLSTAGFEYGTDLTYGTFVSAAQSPLTGTTATGINAEVSGLMPNTLYHYRATGTNVINTSNGVDMTFMTLPLLPDATTLPATAVTNNAATLNGNVNANNASTVVRFEYGLTPAYGSVINAVQSPVSGLTGTPVSAEITGLADNTVYHYRVIGDNAAGTTYGNDNTLLTLPDPLTLDATVTDVTGCYGNINGAITTQVTGGVLPYTYQWSNGAVTSSLTNLGAGSYSVTVTDAFNATISGTWAVNQPAEIILTASIIADADPVCAGTTVTYTVIPVNGGIAPAFEWYVNGGLVSATGNSFTYVPVAGDVISSVVTSSEPCAVPNPATATFNPVVNPLLQVGVSIAASADPVCTGTSATYTATVTNGGTSPVYEWRVNGGPVVGSDISYSYIPVSGDIITCMATSNAGCAINNPATGTYSPVVNPLLPVSVTILASSNPSLEGMYVTYTAIPVNGGSNPSYQWLVNGVNAGTNSPEFSYPPLNGDQVSCWMTSNEPCAIANPAFSNTITMVVTNAPVSLTIHQLTVHDQDSYCFDALVLITVAGDPYQFTVENGGSATMISGTKILYLPGTRVMEGGYMHGYISTEFCGFKATPIGASITGTSENMIITEKAAFKVYPNPTRGNFTIEQKNDVAVTGLKVEIYNMRGERLITQEIAGQPKQEILFNEMPVGLYFVKIIADGYVETIKVIKQ